MEKTRLFNKRLVTLFFILLLLSVFYFLIPSTETNVEADPETHTQVSSLTSDLIKKCFKDLENKTIRLVPYHEDGYFFETAIEPQSLFSISTQQRVYIIKYRNNLTKLTQPPSQEALRAILTHELTHIRDYTKMSFIGVVGLLLKYTTSESFVTSYERQTDSSALSMGFAKGLAQYRLWLYAQLSTQDVEKRKITYFTPEEIKTWSEQNSQVSSCYYE